jgi:hypothetical protein
LQLFLWLLLQDLLYSSLDIQDQQAKTSLRTPPKIGVSSSPRTLIEQNISPRNLSDHWDQELVLQNLQYHSIHRKDILQINTPSNENFQRIINTIQDLYDDGQITEAISQIIHGNNEPTN